MTKGIKLSIIVPVYNGGAYLADALDSLVNQEDNPFDVEVLALDDGSTDNSFEILKSYENKLPLRIIEGAKIGNWVTTTNKAIREAKGEYISFLHQDDIYYPERFNVCGKLLIENPQISILIHSVNYISSESKIVGHWAPPFPMGAMSQPKVLSRLLVQNNISVPGVIFKKSLAEKAGLLDEGLRYTADWDFWLKLIIAGNGYYIPHPLSAFRIHKESQTVSFASKLNEYSENLQIVVGRYSSQLNKLLPRRAARSYQRMAKFGIEMNIFLARLNNKAKGSDIRRFITSLFKIYPWEFFRYLSLSRLFQRVIPRIKL